MHAGVHGEGAQALDVGAHLVEVVGDHLVAVDRLAHAAALGGVGLRQAQGGLAQADRLEADADAGVVHEHEHQLEALAALSEELARHAIEAERRGHRAVVAHLLLDAVELDVALAGAVRPMPPALAGSVRAMTK